MEKNERQTRDRGTGTALVYETLRHDILTMTLKPSAPLDEVRLSERFQMSRTPIREALVRLAGENLVLTLPNRSTIVAPLDFNDIQAYCDALALLQRVVTRLAARNRTGQDLQAIDAAQIDFAAAVEAQDPFRLIVTNCDFHLAIARAGRNKYYTGFYNRLLDDGRRLLRLFYLYYNDALPLRFVQEHERMIEAIRARDEAAADQLALEHAQSTIECLQSLLRAREGASLDLEGI